MKVYAIIRDGEFTDTINGEKFTGNRLEVLAAYTDLERAEFALPTAKPAEPEKWGLCSQSVYEFEVQE